VGQEVGETLCGTIIGPTIKNQLHTVTCPTPLSGNKIKIVAKDGSDLVFSGLQVWTMTDADNTFFKFKVNGGDDTIEEKVGGGRRRLEHVSRRRRRLESGDFS